MVSVCPPWVGLYITVHVNVYYRREDGLSLPTRGGTGIGPSELLRWPQFANAGWDLYRSSRPVKVA